MEDKMKRGDIIELIEDTAFYKKGKKAHFIKKSNSNPSKIEVVWIGEESSYNEFGDVDVYPSRLFK